MQALDNKSLAPTVLNPLVGECLSETLEKISESIQGLNEIACDAGVPISIAHMLDVIQGAVGVAVVQGLYERSRQAQNDEPRKWSPEVVETA